MNNYALEEGFVWFLTGIFVYYFLDPIISIIILGTNASSFGRFLSGITILGGVAIMIEGLFFLDKKNTKYETIGIMGGIRAKKRKEEVELIEANKKWKDLHKEK